MQAEKVYKRLSWIKPIDNKIDDGLPNSGKIRVYNNGKNNCYHDNYYNIKNNKKACSLISLIE